MNHEIPNYDRGIVTYPQKCVQVKNVQEIQTIMKNTAEFPSPVRAMGSFHSLTDCASSGGTIIKMSRMNRIHSIDTKRMTICAEAGVELVDASKALRSMGLQFMTNIEIGNITLGSAACCQTKDALDDVVSGQVNSYVIEIKWVDTAGKLRDASLTRNPGLLYFVRSSYGLCGVIYEVTFRVESLVPIRFTYIPLKVSDLTEKDVSKIISSNDGVICWTVGSVAIFECRNCASEIKPLTRWLADLRRKLWSFITAFVGRSLQTYPPNPTVNNLLLEGWFALLRAGYGILHWIGGFSLYDPDKIVDYRKTPPVGRYSFTFWAFPREQWLKTLKEYLDFAENHFREYGFRCNMPLGSYFIRQDNSSILSYTHEGDIMSIDPIHACTTTDREDWNYFLKRFNDWASQRNGIPLLNQSPFIERRHVAAAYGYRLHKIGTWVKQVDPKRRMLNSFFYGLLK
jgi:hypothetical protein